MFRIYKKQYINRWGITIIAFTGDYTTEYVLSQYRKRNAVEKLFKRSKTFTGGEPVKVHGMNAPMGERFVDPIAIAIRSGILAYMRSSGLLKRYSVEKMILELHKLRKVILQGDHNRDDKEAEGNSGITGHQAGTCAYISEELRF